ncbi:MAG: hypothetical protein M1368_03440 [Thaumarchaeota archaeon]|nr:hypothetical protein [Nitrososphaerota archaeon]
MMRAVKVLQANTRTGQKALIFEDEPRTSLRRGDERMQVHTAGPKEKYARLVKLLTKNPCVIQPIGKKGFGSSGLYTKNRLFAFLSHKNQLILKLPKERVNEIVSKGDGFYWDPRRDGRIMKEWVVLQPSSKLNWLPLVREALNFVNSSE